VYYFFFFFLKFYFRILGYTEYYYECNKLNIENKKKKILSLIYHFLFILKWYNIIKDLFIYILCKSLTINFFNYLNDNIKPTSTLLSSK